MQRKADRLAEVRRYAAGIFVETLYTVFLVAVALLISALALRWF